MMRSGCFSVIAMLLAAIMIFSLMIFPVNAAESENAVYVSAEGKDSNGGSEDAPFLTLAKGISTIAEKFNGDGIVYIVGTVNEGAPTDGVKSYSFKKWSEMIRVEGKDGAKIKFQNKCDINFRFSGPIFFDNINMEFGRYESSQINRIVRFYNQGQRLEFGSQMVCEENGSSLYVIGRGAESEENGIFLRGGTVGHIWLALDAGSSGSDVYLTVSDNALVQNVFTGTSGGDVTVNGHVKVLDGGTISNFYAGGQRGKVIGDVELICAGGYITNAYGTGNTGTPNDGTAVFYLSSDESTSPSSVKDFNEVYYFSATTDGGYSASVKTKSKATCIYTTRFEDAKGTEGDLTLLGSIELSVSLGESGDLLYYMIPIGDRYLGDENFRVLNEKKELVEAQISNGCLIVSAFSSFTGKGYIAYDTSSGASPHSFKASGSDIKLPPIPILEESGETNTPTLPEVPEQKSGTDISLIIMIVLSVIILSGGIIVTMKAKKE